MGEEIPKYPIEIFLSDFVSENTRRERTTLLVLCALAILIATTGLVPSKISALGVDFSSTDQRTLLKVIAGVLAYFALAFVIHALSDYMTWRTAHGVSLRVQAKKEIGDQQKRILSPDPDLHAAIEELRKNNPTEYEKELDRRRRSLTTYVEAPRPKFGNTVVGVRVVFDLLFPVVLALVTGILLLMTEVPASGIK